MIEGERSGGFVFTICIQSGTNQVYENLLLRIAFCQNDIRLITAFKVLKILEIWLLMMDGEPIFQISKPWHISIGDDPIGTKQEKYTLGKILLIITTG
jgi:hypothetical protein